MSKYDYAELRAAALAPSATVEDLRALADWLEQYDSSAWNGEYYDLDEGKRLFPVYDETSTDEWKIVGYEVR